MHLVSIPVNKKSLKQNTTCNHHKEWNRKLPDVSPNILMFLKLTEQIEIIEVCDEHGEQQLNNKVDDQAIPVIPPGLLKNRNLIQVEGKVHQPERKVEEYHSLTLKN